MNLSSLAFPLLQSLAVKGKTGLRRGGEVMDLQNMHLLPRFKSELQEKGETNATGRCH